LRISSRESQGRVGKKPRKDREREVERGRNNKRNYYLYLLLGVSSTKKYRMQNWILHLQTQIVRSPNHDALRHYIYVLYKYTIYCHNNKNNDDSYDSIGHAIMVGLHEDEDTYNSSPL